MKQRIKTNSQVQEPRGSGLFHLTINTGHVVIQEDSFLYPSTYQALLPMLENRGGPIPGMPGLFVRWETMAETQLLVIYKRGVAVIACGLATGKAGADELWSRLLRIKHPDLSLDGVIPQQPPTFPWLAALLLHSCVLLSPCELSMIGCFEACWGLAVMRHQLTRN